MPLPDHANAINFMFVNDMPLLIFRLFPHLSSSFYLIKHMDNFTSILFSASCSVLGIKGIPRGCQQNSWL
jgi:hypothetical protein